jgi:4-amino-4-deoxy-L-arabinose transferase-like glycosyltransferase
MLSHERRRKRAAFLLIILACSYLFLFHNLGGYSLKEPDEGRYAEIPREMVEQGDYVVPHLNYVRYFEKPPLLYWAVALSYRTFGVNEWSFRFPNALAALLCVLMTYLFVSRWFGDEAGFLSSLILLTSLGFFALAHIVTIDMLFSFLLFACLLFFCEYYRERKPFILYLFFAFLALAVLAKGPVALVLLAATIVLFLWSERNLSFLGTMFRVGPILLFGVVAAPWFIVMCVREKEFFQFFFVDQHILRFVTTKHKRSGPLYYFLPVLFGGLFPWSIFIPRAVATSWHTRELRLFLIWSAVVFAFFSISGSKLPPYILPVFPAVSVVLANLFRQSWQRTMRLNRELIAYLVFFSVTALTGLASVTGVLDGYLARLPEIGAVAKAIRPLILAVSMASLGTLVVTFFPKIRTYKTLFCALCVFSLVLFMGVMSHSQVTDRLNTTKELAARIAAMGKPGPVVVSYGSFDETLPFYLKRRTFIANHLGELEMGSRYPDAKGHFLTSEDLARLFRSGKPVVVVLKAKRLSRLPAEGIEGGTMLACQDKRCLLANGSAVEALPSATAGLKSRGTVDTLNH